MSTSPETKSDRIERLTEPIAYGDIFDFPPTLKEIRRFCALSVSEDALQQELENGSDLSRAVSSSDGFYYIKGRDELVELRKQRQVQSKQAWRTAHKVVKFIKYVPFVKGIFVTGSLAVNNARKKDDLDFLVVVGGKRLWFVFFILGVLQRIFSKRFLCPNYYMTDGNLRLPRESLYLARETTQAQPIYGAAVYEKFEQENRWIVDYFPNLLNADRSNPLNDKVQERQGLPAAVTGLFEWVLGGRLGDWVESMLIKLLKHRLTVHYGKHGHEVPREVLQNAVNEVELKFHGLDHERKIYQEMDKRKDLLKTLLNG